LRKFKMAPLNEKTDILIESNFTKERSL